MIEPLFLLAAFGLAWIVGFSTISLPMRKWLGGFEQDVVVKQLDGSVHAVVEKVPGHWGALGPFLCKMIECPGCIGFHMGWVYALGYANGAGEPVKIGKLVFAGAAVAGSNFILGRLTRIIE